MIVLTRWFCLKRLV